VTSVCGLCQNVDCMSLGGAGLDFITINLEVGHCNSGSWCNKHDIERNWYTYCYKLLITNDVGVKLSVKFIE
jgi:hypothetical protein